MLDKLSPREREIVTALAANQLSNKGLARQFGLSDGTIKQHLHNIYRKTGTTSRMQLVVIALQAFAP